MLGVTFRVGLLDRHLTNLYAIEVTKKQPDRKDRLRNDGQTRQTTAQKIKEKDKQEEETTKERKENIAAF